MENNGSPEDSNILSRRKLAHYALDKIAVPAIVGLIAGYTGSYINRRYESKHDISISIIRSDSAAPQEEVDELLLFGLSQEPTPTPIPEEDRHYTYTTLIRNNGDFPEEELIVSISFRGNSSEESLLAGPEIDASSKLLAETITSSDPVDALPSYALSVPRLNPGEWLSLKTSWRDSQQVTVDIRSADVAESASS